MIIEKNIPIPDVGRYRARSIWPLREMQVGDSVLVVGDKVKSARQIISYTKKGTGFDYTTRKVDGGIRIWRTA